MSLSKTANIIGIVAGICSIVFGYLQFIYPWPFESRKGKMVYNAKEFLKNPSNYSFKPGDTLRLEENLTLNWSGVTSCDKPERIQAEYQNAFNSWRDNSRSLIGGFEYLGANFFKGEASTNQTKEPWPDNSRSCTGSGSIDCWIEFIRK